MLKTSTPMRQLLHTSLSILLITFVMGCSRTHTDRRLVLADSLMWTAPDSALHILNAINRDSLQGDENLAYHALLLTQAQFRCNGHCASDTLINTAINHYSDNHNREHYTRALLYKGAYYEFNTNQPVEAMRYYKMAEDNADTTDYRNLAQINMRLAIIYYYNFVGKNFDLKRFKKSLYYYTILDNISSIMLCHSYIGNIYRFTNQDSARHHLVLALKIAREIGDSCEIGEIYNSLSKSYLQDNAFTTALHYAKKCMSNSCDSGAGHLCFYNLSRAYSGLGMTDSARHFLDMTSDTSDMQLQDNRYLALRDYYSATGNNEQFKKYNNLYLALSDSLESNQNIAEFVDADSKHRQDFINQKKQEASYSSKKATLITIVIIAFALILFFVLQYRHRSKTKQLQLLLKSQSEKDKSRIKDILTELRESSSQLKSTKENLKETSKQYASLTGLLTAHINVMHTLTEASQNQTKDVFIKTFAKTVNAYKANDNLYDNITRYLNEHYGNLINDIQKGHTGLNDEDLKIIKLVALGFTYIDVAVLLGKNPNAMSTRFTRIARKIGANVSLPKHIDMLKKKGKHVHH